MVHGLPDTQALNLVEEKSKRKSTIERERGREGEEKKRKEGRREDRRYGVS